MVPTDGAALLSEQESAVKEGGESGCKVRFAALRRVYLEDLRSARRAGHERHGLRTNSESVGKCFADGLGGRTIDRAGRHSNHQLVPRTLISSTVAPADSRATRAWTHSDCHSHGTHTKMRLRSNRQ